MIWCPLLFAHPPCQVVAGDGNSKVDYSLKYGGSDTAEIKGETPIALSTSEISPVRSNANTCSRKIALQFSRSLSMDESCLGIYRNTP